MIPNERPDAKIRIGVAVSDTVNDPVHTWHSALLYDGHKHTSIHPDAFTDSMTAQNDRTILLSHPKHQKRRKQDYNNRMLVCDGLL